MGGRKIAKFGQIIDGKGEDGFPHPLGEFKNINKSF